MPEQDGKPVVLTTRPIVQIIPASAPGHSGVADYAAILAQKLKNCCGRDSTVGHLDSLGKDVHADVILHYVNYGYHPRGIPNELVSALNHWRRDSNGRLLTIFHETYAAGSILTSTFWLQRLQKRIARLIAEISDHCIVNNEVALAQLRALAPDLRAQLHPTFSNFGEPNLTFGEIENRDPHHWVVFGGTRLIARSLESFLDIYRRLPPELTPRKLDIFGGDENAGIRTTVDTLGTLEASYRPAIPASDASGILRQAAFAWIDYFHRRDVAPGVILKSGVFAACCAHAVIPVLPHNGRELSFNGQPLPGPFYIENQKQNLPSVSGRAQVAQRFYDFYHRFVAADLLARKVAQALPG